MKLSTKIILPIILISALLILLSGCAPTTPSPGATTTTGGTITGIFETPEACCMGNRDHTEGWVPLVNATVSVIDVKGVTHTTKTDSDGKYWLTDVAPGIYYVITACCECEDGEGVYKDVVEEELKEGDTYDAGIADCESSALGLMVDFLLSGDVFEAEDCNCYCNCFDEESQIYASLVYTGVKLRAAAINLQSIPSKPLDAIRANADFQAFLPELCDLLEACCVEPGVTPIPPPITTYTPAISVTKTADPVSADVGDTITYTYVVKNIGNVSLNSITAVDNKLGAVTLDKTTLAPGETATGTPLTYVVVEGDPDPIVNTVNAEGTYGATKAYASASASVPMVNPCADNTKPSITDPKEGDNIPAVQGIPFTYPVIASDPDIPAQTLTYTLDAASLALGMAIGADGIITWTSPICDCLDGQLEAEIKNAKSDRIFITPSCSYPVTVTVTDPCDLTDTVTFNVEVTCSVQMYTLTLNVAPLGSGTTIGQGPYAPGTIVNISASANPHWIFQNWTVDDGSTANVVGNLNAEPLTVTMNEDMTLTAHFMADIFKLGMATIAFEDLEIPERTLGPDYDYNDWVAGLDIETSYDGDTPNLKQVKFTVTPLARGAGYDHRFHILIPKDTFSQDGTYTLDVIGEATDSGTFTASADNDFEVIPDTRAALGGGTHNHTNTKECEGPISATVTAVLTIDFSSPFYHDFSQYDPYSGDSMHGEGLFFDPYLEIDRNSGDYKYHDPPEDVVHKKDDRMLTVPVDWKWPEEGEAIWDVYTSGVTDNSPGAPDFVTNWWTSGNNCAYDGTLCGGGTCPPKP